MDRGTKERKYIATNYTNAKQGLCKNDAMIAVFGVSEREHAARLSVEKPPSL